MTVDPKSFFSGRDSDDKRTVAAIEEKVVKSILRRFDLLPYLAFLKSECSRVTGSSDISLAWFQQEYQSFPLWMGARTVPWVRDLWGELRDRFTKTDLFQAWDAVGETKADTDDRAVGLVFTWPAFGECILHNNWKGGNIGFERVSGLRIVVTLKSLGEPLVVEPFAQFLQSLEWPESGALFGR